MRVIIRVTDNSGHSSYVLSLAEVCTNLSLLNFIKSEHVSLEY